MHTAKPDWCLSLTRTPDVVVLLFAHVSGLPGKLRDAIARVPQAKTIIHELYMNSDHAYVVGIGEHRETLLIRFPRRLPDDFGCPETVLLPASEFEERAPLDLVTEAIQNEAWN
jgi:hypothetical protein